MFFSAFFTLWAMSPETNTVHEVFQNYLFKETTQKSSLTDLSESTQRNFIASLLPHVPDFYKGFLSQDDLARFIAGRLSYIYKKTSNKPKVSITLSGPEEFWLAQTTVLECITDESPFIIDSLLEFLQSTGIKIRALINPVIKVSREKGLLKEIYIDRTKNTDKLENYSIFLLDKKTVKDKKFIVKEVNDILTNISLVVRDYSDVIQTAESALLDNELYEWLRSDNFIFLGYKDRKKKLGIFKSPGERLLPDSAAKDKSKDDRFFVSQHQSSINKFRKVSLLKVGEQAFIAGMFTRKAESTSAARIPFLVKKLNEKFKKEKSLQTLFGKKDFFYAFNLIPLSYSFSINLKSLIEVCEEISYARIKSDKLVRLIEFEPGRAILVLLLPLDEYSDKKSKRLKKRLKDEKLGIIFETSETLSHSVFTFMEVKAEEKIKSGQFPVIESSLLEELQSWFDTMNWMVERELSENQIEFFQQYILQAVPESYKSAYIGKPALRDLRDIYEVFNANYRIKVQPDGDEMSVLILAREKRTLTDFVPVLDDFGLEVLKEESYEFPIKGEVIHYFKFFVLYKKKVLDDKQDRKRLESAIKRVYEDRTSTETINELVLSAGLNIHQVNFLKALIAYLFQVKRERSRKLIKDTLLENPDIPKAIVAVFQNRFLNKLSSQYPEDCHDNSDLKLIFPGFDTTKSFQDKYEKLTNELTQKVKPKTTAQLEIFENLQRIISAIYRTNYFLFKDEISFKIKGDSLDFLRDPRPYFEMWVYHRLFEGVHLRGGPVSRGGIRWSDRKDDFRTEVWGLFKTQVLKNTVIVPTGSKGGFVLKKDENNRDRAVDSYKRVMGSFLNLTDNLVKGKIKYQTLIPRLDSDDPYLVVAADKGTAAFSDYANEVSESMNFWLGDAFASGGKNGYSHKEYGITARGSWESARWHFHMRGLDVDQDLFTVVGIGDMSGDVFGNGMLLSRKTRLVAAFNHMHIFIDPNPDAEKSYKERERLFKDPKLKWTDYNSSLISKGGGVFSRAALSIDLTPEIRDALGTEQKRMNGDELIKIILKAPVDMLFNGGIGTYIKAETETNDKVGDLANDQVRVNAIDLRCSMIVEGGNLGITALGRAEFSLSGGIINTDALDNSGGVDMSDHEVNLKILFKKLLESGKIKDQQERNKLLKKLSAKEVNLVLGTNFVQNRALNQVQAAETSEQLYALKAFERLENQGLLKRDSEFLPAQVELENIFKSHQLIPKPYLAILLAYEKLEAQSLFVAGNSKLSNRFLMQYFPSELHTYEKEILGHPLSAEIKNLTMVNYVLDHGGILYLEKARSQLNLDTQQAIERYIEVDHFLDAAENRKKMGLPTTEKRNLNKTDDPVVNFAMALLVEKSIFRFLEMTVLFPLSGKDGLPADTNKLHHVQFSPKLQPAFPDWINSLKESSRRAVIDRWYHIEIRFVMQYILKVNKAKYSSCADFYFKTGLLTLKRALYRQEPRSKWEVFLLLSLKRRFWEGVVSSYKQEKAFLARNLNLDEEIEKLELEGLLDLSTLGGLIGFTFDY